MTGSSEGFWPVFLRRIESLCEECIAKDLTVENVTDVFDLAEAHHAIFIEEETVKTGERVGFANLSKKSFSQLSNATVVDMDDRGMKLLASLAATETSKDRQVLVVGATECSSATAEGSVDESTIRSSVDKVHFNPSNDAYDRRAICIKGVKDRTVAKESPIVSTNDLLNNIQTIGMPVPQKDMYDSPKALESPSSEDSEDLNFSSDGTGKGPVYQYMFSEHKITEKREDMEVEGTSGAVDGEVKEVAFVAHRVAYSITGTVASLSGQPREGISLEARSLSKGSRHN